MFWTSTHPETPGASALITPTRLHYLSLDPRSLELGVRCSHRVNGQLQSTNWS